LLSDILDFLCRLEASDDLSFLINKEFSEVPLDVGLLFVIGVSLGEHVVQDVGNGVLHVPASKAFLFFQELEQWVGIVTIHLYLLETGKFGAEVQFTELVDALVSARSLLTKLVAREVENLEALCMVLLVQGFQFVVLWGKTALGGGVDD